MKNLKYLLALMIVGIFTACEQEDPEPDTSGDPPTFVLNDATNVTTNGADLSGNVTGEDLQDVGFVYGTTSTLNESSLRSSVGMVEGDISTSLWGINDNTEYFFAAYAENSNGDFFTSEVKSFTTEEEIVLAIGDTYQGGIIYYLDWSGEHGRIASPVNITSGTNWQTAYDACYAYSLNGNDNWRMPNLSELEELYAQKDNVGGFADIAYWSRSIEGSNPNLAYGVFFGGGANAGESFVYDITGTYQYSRAIRDF